MMKNKFAQKISIFSSKASFKRSLFLFFLSCVHLLGGAPSKAPSSSNFLQIKVENQELELNRLEQRLNNQDLTLEAIRKELESLKEKNNQKEITALNQRLDTVINDLKTLHSFLEKTDQELSRQNSALNEVHTTLQTVASAFDETAGDSTHLYIVQTGDTLGEIAIKNRTTIKKIKELNEMSKDTIFVGQKLRLTK